MLVPQIVYYLVSVEPPSLDEVEKYLNYSKADGKDVHLAELFKHCSVQQYKVLYHIVESMERTSC